MEGQKTTDNKITKLATAPLQSPLVLALLSTMGLVLAYGAASWAIDSGRLTAYALTLVLFGLSLRYAGKCIYRLIKQSKTV